VNKEQRAESREQRTESREQRAKSKEQDVFSLLFAPCSRTFGSMFFEIDLQWFSDDDDAPGKTEQPTEHKLRRLREEGQVVKSQELIAAIGLFLPALFILFIAPSMMRTCIEMVRFFFLRAVELDPTKDAIIALVFIRYFAILALPILAIAVFAALFSNILQVGLVFTTKPLVPNFSRIIPRIGQFFKRIFSV
jgi:flagellar biosynthetic protein FlhB